MNKKILWGTGIVAAGALAGGALLYNHYYGFDFGKKTDSGTVIPAAVPAEGDKKLEAEVSRLEADVKRLEAEKKDLFKAELPADHNPADTESFRDTHGDRPIFISAGLGGSQLHDAKFVSARYMTDLGNLSIANFVDNLPVFAEASLKLQEAQYFRDQPGAYRMPFGISFSGSILANLAGKNVLDHGNLTGKILAPGVFAEVNYADFDGFMQKQWDFKTGLRFFAKGDYDPDKKAWQADAKLGFLHRETKSQGLHEAGDGASLEALAGIYFRNGISLFANGGIGFLDGRAKGFGYDFGTSETFLTGGVAVAFDPISALQLRAYLDGYQSNKRYGNSLFSDDKYAMGELGIGARILPLGRVYSFDSDKRLFLPVGEMYFDASAWVTQSPTRKFDFGGALEVGFR